MNERLYVNQTCTTDSAYKAVYLIKFLKLGSNVKVVFTEYIIPEDWVNGYKPNIYQILHREFYIILNLGCWGQRSPGCLY